MALRTEHPASLGAEVATISAVGTAHFASHVLQLAFAPLFVLMREDLGVSYTELGALLSLFYLFSGTGQVLAGVLVDRFGAHRLLLGGIVLQGGATAVLGLAPTYAMMLPLAALAGLGNSVYHPADLSILSHKVSSRRLGRAFAAHAICGNLGYAASPLLSGAIAAHWGWRTALVALGLSALVVAAGLLLSRDLLRFTPERTAQTGPASTTAGHVTFRDVLLTPVVVFAFLYFFLTAISLVGMQSFSITALQEGFAVPAAWAAVAVTLYQLGTACGIGVGGVLADRIERHDIVAMSGLTAAALITALMAAVGTTHVAGMAVMAAIGFTVGLTTPSRDVLVRRCAPAGATGKVFGVVYSGYDVGSLVGPLIYGLLLDHHMPTVVFLAAAVPFALAVPTVFGVRTPNPHARRA